MLLKIWSGKVKIAAVLAVLLIISVLYLMTETKKETGQDLYLEMLIDN